jgi:hypothetical protein
MPTRCDRCGNESYVIYVKPNPGNICEECEDEERRIKGIPGDWDTIRKNNRQRNYHQNNERRSGKVLHLNNYREFACESNETEKTICCRN